MSGGGKLVVFDTTHHALWAEEVARELGLAVEIVPAPAESSAGCDLALETLTEDLPGLAAALRERSIVFRIFSRA